MQHEPISAEDAELLARITRLVLAEPERFARGSELLRERFSHAAMRKRALAELCELRRATYGEEQERHMETWIAQQPGKLWRNAYGRLLFHQPGRNRRFHREHIRWTHSSGQRTDRVYARFDEALRWAREFPRALVTLREAEAICLLAWMLYDDRADERQPVLSDFQLLPWESFPDGVERYQPARDNAADDFIRPEWAELARIALAKVEANRVAARPQSESESSVEAKPVPLASADPAFLSVDSIAEIGRVPAEPLRKRLQRWRPGNDVDWIEDANPRRGEPRYLYRWGAIQAILRDLRES